MEVSYQINYVILCNIDDNIEGKLQKGLVVKSENIHFEKWKP